MNKAKIVLSSLIFIAVIGGALAFKAQKFGLGIYRSITSTLTFNINGLQASFLLCGSPDFTTTNAGPVSTYYTATTSVVISISGGNFTVNNICTGQTTSRALFIGA